MIIRLRNLTSFNLTSLRDVISVLGVARYFCHDLSFDFLKEIALKCVRASEKPQTQKYHLYYNTSFYFLPHEKESRQKFLLSSYFYIQINCKSGCQDIVSCLKYLAHSYRKQWARCAWEHLETRLSLGLRTTPGHFPFCHLLGPGQIQDQEAGSQGWMQRLWVSPWDAEKGPKPESCPQLSPLPPLLAQVSPHDGRGYPRSGCPGSSQDEPGWQQSARTPWRAWRFAVSCRCWEMT